MTAATYLRSSKDRHDVSIDAQRRELSALAKAKQKTLVAEFADAVESGKDEDRPGFQSLLSAIRNPRRGWNTLFVLDTSRIARRRNVAYFFEEECRKHGIHVLYKSMPESNPVTDVLLKAIMQALDEWHSLSSRQKGLAGMRENVRQGFRAGGRAPIGYQLESIATGAQREGAAVTKSRLVLSADAPALQAYLKARARGVKRAVAAAGLTASPSSLVGIEWNALTYAGHTVWNVHAEAGSGAKRRPRAEWVIQHSTHEALITDEEAEAILARLEAYAPTRSRERGAGYVLAGLLVAPDGQVYTGDRGSYRVKGRYVKAEAVDRAVAAHVLADMQSPAFVRAVTAAAHAMKAPAATEPLREALQTTERRLARLVALVEQTDTPAPLLRRMEAIEGERERLGQAVADAEHEAAERAALSRITEHGVRRILVERAAALQTADPEALRAAMHGLVERVVLDGDELQVHYRVGRPGKSRGLDPELAIANAAAPPRTRFKDSSPWGRQLKPAAIAVIRKYRIA